jgi:hypothetical protein
MALKPHRESQTLPAFKFSHLRAGNSNKFKMLFLKNDEVIIPWQSWEYVFNVDIVTQ